MDIKDFTIQSGRVISEEKNEQGFNVVYNLVDLINGDKTPVGYVRIEDYPVRSGRMISEEKNENGENKVYNIVDVLKGHFGELGALAYKDSASGSYTPQGTISNPTLLVTYRSDSIPVMTSEGTLPSFDYDASSEALTFNAGSLPINGIQEINFIDSVTLTTPPTFTGKAETITVS
ncbi:MAG: hypothetical protein IJ736_02400 [Firmicutes bacterium]|nr:hypothetical protein [Bacillota bacterium]